MAAPAKKELSYDTTAVIVLILLQAQLGGVQECMHCSHPSQNLNCLRTPFRAAGQAYIMVTLQLEQCVLDACMLSIAGVLLSDYSSHLL